MVCSFFYDETKSIKNKFLNKNKNFSQSDFNLSFDNRFNDFLSFRAGLLEATSIKIQMQTGFQEDTHQQKYLMLGTSPQGRSKRPSGRSKRIPRRSQTAQDAPKTSPKRSQETPRRPQDVLQTAQYISKAFQRRHKIVPRRSKIGFECTLRRLRLGTAAPVYLDLRKASNIDSKM